MDIQQLYKLYEAHPMITTDSRDCRPGSIFLALKGASFDGNLFARSALEKGCSYAIVDSSEAVVKGDSRYILADDCLKTFKLLAREHRRRHPVPVIAITGTNGKTTTKELIAAVLSRRFNVLFTEGNFNNDVGVPKTLFRLSPEHEMAVVEMGASHPGDIKTLVETAEPTCGLITNVGRAHLEGFGSFEGVKKTKGELYDYLASCQGLVFIDRDNADLCEMARQRGIANTVGYGTGEGCNIRGRVVSCSPFLCFEWTDETLDGKTFAVETHLVGAYNITNMLAAIAVGRHFCIDAQTVSEALAAYIPKNNRSQLTATSRNQLIVDAYNANPTSMLTALKSFAMISAPGKMAILGDMRELGKASEEEHQSVADFIASHREELGEVWLVGHEFMKVSTDLRRFSTTEEVGEELRRHPVSSRTILIKGSNGMRLYQLPELL
ncbi:MAG: UDP-N-acetylmuramoyl-tripeptide--D-alanyl-D-alanine ligase [Prevotella sp.]|nr:UDP-N-acetylmuramoyl-tripeptide--D-alanyl-D-alanine ligase [Prevotella sp.]